MLMHTIVYMCIHVCEQPGVREIYVNVYIQYMKEYGCMPVRRGAIFTVYSEDARVQLNTA